MMRRRKVVALTLFGAALRLYQIGAQSLWLDELFSVFVAQREWGQIVADTAQDTMPPLYYFSLHLVLQFGSDEVAVRAPALFFSVAAVPLLYLLARELFDVRVARLAALLLALNPFHVLFAQEARMYAQLAFFALAGQYFFIRGWREGAARDWFLFALFQALAFYSHNLAFLNLLALDVFALTQWGNFRRSWRALFLAHALVLLAFAPWAVILVQQAARVQSGFWASVPSPLAFFTTVYLFLFSDTVPVPAVPLALFSGLALVAFALLTFRRNASSALAFALCTFLIPPATLFLFSLIRPIFVERTLLPASFGLYILLAWAMAYAEPRRLIRAFAVLLIVLDFAALGNYYFDPAVQKPPMRDAARAVESRFEIGDVVAHTSDTSALAFMYYAPQLPSYFLAGDPDYVVETTRGQSGRIAGLTPASLETIVSSHSRVWLVVALDHNVEYQTSRVRELDATFAQTARQDIGTIAVLLFELRH